MGEVYRARDTSLGRDVAIKVLPQTFSADPERLSRFEREARLLASLNHPHIATIHGVETRNEVRALVLELIEGPTLAERLQTGAIPTGEAIDIARQIAEAVEVAHERGIIHRDLKPANVKLTGSGAVKVLDFGLAKVLAGPATSAAADALTVAPSATGVILGTTAYMSPEQARGQVVDSRTDIWAFGCVLYEMLTGQRAFGGTTISDTIAAILQRDVDWSLLPGGTPPELRRLLKRCLQKDVRKRLRNLGDARLELDDAMTPSSSKAPERPSSPRPLWIALATAGGAALATLVALLVFSSQQGREARADVRVHQLTDFAGLEESPAFSPDGKSVAFTAAVGSRRQVYVKLLAGGPPLQVTRDLVVDHLYPRWTSDSSSIVYFSPGTDGDVQGTTWQVAALGGTPHRLGVSVGGIDVNATDGRLAFFRLAERRIELMIAPPDGSSGNVVASFEPRTYYLNPRWSPDGQWIAFQRGDRLRFDVFAVPSRGGDVRQLTDENSVINGFSWLPDSDGILYSSTRGNTMPYLATAGLWAVSLHDRTPRQVTTGELSYLAPDVARDGTIVAARMRIQTDIWRFPIDGIPVENTRNGIRLTRQTGQVLTPTASPSGDEVGFLSDSGGHANLWVLDAARNQLRQITHERDPAVAVGVPVWSPEGRALAFVSSRGNPGLTFGVWLVSPDGSNLRQLANPGLGPAWSQDGRWVYYSTRGDTTGSGAQAVLRKTPVDGGTPITVRTEEVRNVIGVDGSTLYFVLERSLMDGKPGFEIRAANPEDAPSRLVDEIPASRVPLWQIVNPAMSPDGQWLAQPLTDGFTTNIWVLSTAARGWRQVTDFGDRATVIGRRVSWSADGRSILAAVGDGDADITLLEGLLTVQRTK